MEILDDRKFPLFLSDREKSEKGNERVSEGEREE